MKKTTLLKNLVNKNELSFLMEAHNGLSAKIAEEAGFEGLWGSGLSISASLGVRDNNEASWTQVLEVLEFMADATTIPILLDGDTGYGNFNNMRRLVKKLEQRDVAGVCIEDKLFPKTNSFLNGEKQELANIEEFSKKISAAKDTQSDDDFVVIARVEAFIAGWGLQEALKRAEAYRKAGADGVLIHSKLGNVSEIEQFMKEWGNRLPVIIVPTKYYSTPTEKFKALGISTVIWANHNLRSSIKAMQATSQQIFKTQTLIGVEENVAKLDEVFRLQGADELAAAEDKYLPTFGKKCNAIILAAAQGKLGELTESIPKTLIKVGETSILEMLLQNLRSVGLNDLCVVRGFAKDKINFQSIKYIDNNDHATTSALYSLYLAKDELKDETVICFGDIIFKRYILLDLLDNNSDAVLIADPTVGLNTKFTNDNNRDLIECDQPYDKTKFNQIIKLKKISNDANSVKIHGEFIGVLKLKNNALKVAKNLLNQYFETDRLKHLTLNDFIFDINTTLPVEVIFIKDSWVNINSIKDLPLT
jgi:phosphoenolpyruvate phosphomutase